MDWNKIRMLESLGLCQKWQLCLKQDGMHPEQKPLESVLHLRLWPDGGVTGVVERDKGLGDIFGHWDMKSICFFILNRPRTRFMDKVNQKINGLIIVTKWPLALGAPAFPLH